MIHMSNNRHVTNVILLVHDPTKLFSGKLHLHFKKTHQQIRESRITSKRVNICLNSSLLTIFAHWFKSPKNNYMIFKPPAKQIFLPVRH